jgi:hypothetical protein
MDPISTVLAVVSIGATVSSANQAKKANKLQQRQQEVQSAASRRAAIREMQIKRAQTVAGAQAAGASYGSGMAGGLSSLSSQVGSNLGYSTEMSGLSKQISIASQKADTMGAIAGLGMTAFNGVGGWDSLANTFKKG